MFILTLLGNKTKTKTKKTQPPKIVDTASFSLQEKLQLINTERVID